MNDLLRKRSFGQLLRSISLNKNDYSPQLIEISGSKSHFLATTFILGQAPSRLTVTLKQVCHALYKEYPLTPRA